ncbi:MAG: hypothetical protein ACHBN1_33485 [Heteroscytonema crispum UTEX LB 1556]
MNLPFIFDVALGLIFSFLILSLLASEIQELIATVLQWRAEHLRKSIEIMLAGDVENSENSRVIELVNQIYDNPLIKSINQEAKGLVSTLPRKATWAIASLYRSLKQALPIRNATQTAFGDSKRSAPSYIPSDIFATSLMDTLEIPLWMQKLTEIRLEKFKNARISEIENILFQLQEQANNDEKFAHFYNNVYSEFAELRADFEQITWNFQEKKADLNTTINRMSESMDKYIDGFQVDMPAHELTTKSLRRLKFLRKDIFDDMERAISLGGLRPNINEVVESIHRGSAVYTEIEEAIKDTDSETHRKFQSLGERLPQSVKDNIAVVAKRAQTRIYATKEGINVLKQELAHTFDNSMERASGVYKRNAKGVGILIGFVLAVGANADTFNMVSRLSKDSALRNTITANAGNILLQNPPPGVALDLNTLKEQTNSALNDISLPIGWDEGNLKQQINWSPREEKSFPFLRLLGRIPGWIVSAFAIGMGAPFWFDLLGKFINVRNAGRRPSSSYKSSSNNGENAGN